MLLSNRREVARTTPRGRNKFSYWPVCVALCGGADFPSTLKSLTVVPLRGGDRREDLPFERIIPGGCSDSVDRRPTGYRGCESKRGDARCAQGNKHGSYVFVDSSQITGGRTTPGKHPVAPAAATFQKDSLCKPEVSLNPSGVRTTGKSPS